MFVNVAVEVNDVNEVNEEDVGNEHVKEVLGKFDYKNSRRPVECNILALRDDNGDTMQGVELGGGGWGRKITMWSLVFQESWMRLTQMQH